MKNKINSNNSHRPPSQDQNRSKKKQSLREPTEREVGGQARHEGKTLEFRNKINQIIKYSPIECSCCGNNISSSKEELVSKRQIIYIPLIALQCIEHQVYKKQCSYGHTTISDFTQYVSSPMQYGSNVESIIGYLHARQYLPYDRTKEIAQRCNGFFHKHRWHP